MNLKATRDDIKAKFHDVFMEMIDSAPMSIVITDSKARIEYVNSYFTQLTGYSFDEALGSNPRILQSGQTSPEVYGELWSQLLQGGSWKGEFINLKENGDIYIEIASIFPIKDKMGQLHYAAFKIDGTEQKKILDLVNLDPLTSLYNRLYLDKRLQTDLDSCFEDNKPLSLIFLDLDCFKEINDLYGHPTGDQVLRSVARLLRANIRSQDGWIARYGGDEFVVCLPAIDADIAHRIAERLRLVLAGEPLNCEGTDVRISCSIGVHTVTRGSEENTPEDLMQAADHKMYLAKERGRNLVIS